MLNAFCRVAPSLRFNMRAILAAGVFFRASDFNSPTCAFVHARLFDAFLAIESESPVDKAILCRWKYIQMKASRTNDVAGLSSRRSLGSRAAKLFD
jgi:hypothetical protein